LESYRKKIIKLSKDDNWELQDEYTITFKSDQKNNTDEKPFDITILGLVHGNEVGSVSILNNYIDNIGSIITSKSYCLSLANIPAYLQNKRFIDEDLNRIFGMNNNSIEGKIAERIEKIICKSKYVLDLHQTYGPCVSPFFIFHFSKDHYKFARSLDKNTPVISFKGTPFFGGTTLNEFARKNNTIAITFELGELGFCKKQKILGTENVIKAICSRYDENIDYKDNNLYAFDKIVYAPKGHKLKKGIIDMSYIKKGDILSNHNGYDIRSDIDGRLIFPIYTPASSDDSKDVELGRLIRKVSIKEFLE
jgi:succinylglutamate desuccinylase